MEKRLILLVILNTAFINTQAQNALESVKNKLIGKWISADKHVTLNYAPNRKYQVFTDGVEFLSFNYAIKVINDSVFIYHTEGVLQMKNLVFLTDSQLVQTNYKIGEGINEHIDEVGIFYKENARMDTLSKVNEDSIKTHFLLPKDFKGEIMIAYQQPINTYLGNEKQIIIPQSGLLKVKNQADIYKFIKRQFTFLYTNNNALEIPVFEPNRIYTEVELNKYNENTICVLPLGYNQLGRIGVNEVFGETIIGNVEMYKVDVLKNLVKLLSRK
jgi:hypothetical protein